MKEKEKRGGGGEMKQTVVERAASARGTEEPGQSTLLFVFCHMQLASDHTEEKTTSRRIMMNAVRRGGGGGASANLLTSCIHTICEFGLIGRGRASHIRLNYRCCQIYEISSEISRIALIILSPLVRRYHVILDFTLFIQYIQ